MADGDPDRSILLVFGERVRAERERQGLSQEQLAAKAGMDRTYVGGIERGERNPALLNINRLAVALDEKFAGLLPHRPAGKSKSRPTRRRK